ncbi:MAG: MerR family transcriptional regulator [Actinomycetales bacterium]
MYTIKRAAELTGIPQATLRAWERRYRIVAPGRSTGGYRLYDDEAIRRLRMMRTLVATGLSPARAAEQLANRSSGRRQAPPDEPGTRASSSAVAHPVGAPPDGADATDLAAGPRHPGGVRPASPSGPSVSTPTSSQSAPPTPSGPGSQPPASAGLGPSRVGVARHQPSAHPGVLADQVGTGAGTGTESVADDLDGRAFNRPGRTVGRSVRGTFPDHAGHPNRPGRGAGAFGRTDTADRLGERFVSAAMSMDNRELVSTLDSAFVLGEFEDVVDLWLMPTLVEIGRRWEAGHLSVAAEHLVSAAVLRRLATCFDTSGSDMGEPVLLVGLAPGSRHEIGVLAFAVACRRLGVATVYLGADVPVEGWREAVRATGVRAVVLGIGACDDPREMARVVEALTSHSAELRVFVGGSRQGEAPVQAVRLGHRIGPAASWLCDELAYSSRSPSR